MWRSLLTSQSPANNLFNGYGRYFPACPMLTFELINKFEQSTAAQSFHERHHKLYWSHYIIVQNFNCLDFELSQITLGLLGAIKIVSSPASGECGLPSTMLRIGERLACLLLKLLRFSEYLFHAFEARCQTPILDLLAFGIDEG